MTRSIGFQIGLVTSQTMIVPFNSSKVQYTFGEEVIRFNRTKRVWYSKLKLLHLDRQSLL